MASQGSRCAPSSLFSTFACQSYSIKRAIMIFRSSRSTNYVALAFLVFFGMAGSANAAPFFQAGANGTDGIDGDPGTDGFHLW